LTKKLGSKKQKNIPKKIKTKPGSQKSKRKTKKIIGSKRLLTKKIKAKGKIQIKPF